MLNKNNIEVYSSPNALEITLKWFTPKAIFLAFFSLFWMGFMAVWYGISFGVGAPLIVYIFPIVHLAAGLYLSYITLCSFFNKSYVDIRDGYLTVTHKPIPWWKGNLDIPANELKQLYVHQTTKSGKNGTTYGYVLRAKLFNGKDIEVLAIPELSSLQLKQIEEHVENHLGIEDESVKGEYERSRSKSQSEKPRKQRRSFSNTIFAPLYFLKNGDALNFKNEELELINITQFDWSDGNTDKYFQCVNYQKQEQLIYVEQNLSLLDAFASEKLSLLDVGNFVFDTKNPEDSIEYKGKVYLLTESKQGKKFLSSSQRSFEAKQWKYQAKDGLSSIRVTASDKTIQYSLFTRLIENDFDTKLDLDKFPDREIDYRSNNFDDEDFV